jgi:hypothetical protein
MSVEGDKFQSYDNILVDPKADRRDSEIVLLQGEETAEFTLPFKYVAAMNGSYRIYSQNNDVLAQAVPLSDSSVSIDAGYDRSAVIIPAAPLEPSLAARLLVMKCKVNGRTKTYSYKYWCITPQVALAASMIEDFLNKSRIENVIPELEYTDGDIVSYLERGLYMFNMTGIPTAYTGLNMQGAILDCWVTCSSYWALASQLIAEGSLAFDFSGQGVSLNVDRTPQLDSALGRIESRIQDTVLPLKKQMAAQGYLAGDGSAGATSMHNPYSMGVLSMINAPTTRINGFSNFIGRRF